MFTISQEQKHYHTYILTDEEAKSQIEVVPERGGIITRWRINDREILYLDEERYADPTKTVRGGVPILFPICGNLPYDTFNYQGESYKLVQHGFGRRIPWKVRETNNSNCASITITLESDQETLRVYPFEFAVSYTYELRGNSVKISQTYTNNSEVEMPFSAGFHPYFQIGDKQKLEVEIPGTEYTDNLSKATIKFSGEFDYQKDEIDAAFTSITANSTSFSDRDRQKKVTIKYSDLFSTLVFWTVKGKNFICVEPWSAPRNGINTGEQIMIVKPGTSCKADVEMICEQI
ncbi:Galactose mutarotase-like enzyme [Hyella patelloides LEGE 07179]|uniref:Galactose mutarotase-like enzyme n=1 Tax=Hyella patelloides LEGE 07179 TaxID=945734 RepID=A0A563VXG8_9CYAN|nr:aldose epimerase [Hyella patelloides]VEP16077.1 Galactose mutarotase-like enzyme [Hyella patelloides LEGE 07179]